MVNQLRRHVVEGPTGGCAGLAHLKPRRAGLDTWTRHAAAGWRTSVGSRPGLHLSTCARRQGGPNAYPPNRYRCNVEIRVADSGTSRRLGAPSWNAGRVGPTVPTGATPQGSSLMWKTRIPRPAALVLG